MDAALTELGLLVAKRGDEVLAAARDLIDFARHRGRLFKGQLKLGSFRRSGPICCPNCCRFCISAIRISSSNCARRKRKR